VPTNPISLCEKITAGSTVPADQAFQEHCPTGHAKILAGLQLEKQQMPRRSQLSAVLHSVAEVCGPRSDWTRRTGRVNLLTVKSGVAKKAACTIVHHHRRWRIQKEIADGQTRPGERILAK